MIGQLLERLRARFDLDLVIFDVSFTPLMPAADSEICKVIRETPGGVNAAFQAALKSGQSQRLSAGDLRMAVHPLRRDRSVVGLLVIGARPGSFGAAESQTTSDEDRRLASDLDRRLDQVGQSLRVAIESDILASARLAAERSRARRLRGIHRFLGQLPEIATERELMQAVVQAAAVWYDLDAWIYRRDSRGQFTLDTWLPGADPVGRPRVMSESALTEMTGMSGIAVCTRISSIVEIEELGWTNTRGDLLLLPIGSEGRTLWLMAISANGPIDEEVESTFAAVAATLAAALERLASLHARALQGRLLEVIRTGGAPERLATSLLQVIAADLSVEWARLLVEADGTVRTLATATPGHRSALPVDAADLIALSLPIAPGASARMELLPAGEGVSPVQMRALEAAVGPIQSWLSGVLDRLPGTPNAVEAALTPAFEHRIREEIARAKRFDLEVALIVLEAPAATVPPNPRALDPVIHALREQLRSSDLIGLLDGGEIGALLVHTGAPGVAAAAGRVRRRLGEMRRSEHLPVVSLGQAAFPSGGGSAAALIASARSDAARPVAALA